MTTSSTFKIPLVLILLLLAGCSNDSSGLQGTEIGNQFARGQGKIVMDASNATDIDSYINGQIFGGATGATDSRLASDALKAATFAPLYDPVVWKNPVGKRGGSFTAIADGHNPADGAYCRRFLQVVKNGNRLTGKSEAVGCRQWDGTWIIAGKQPLK